MKLSRTALIIAVLVAGAGALYAAGVLRWPSTAGIEKLQDPGY